MGKRNLTIRVDDEEMAWFKQEAEAQMRPIGNFIMWLVRQYRDQRLIGSVLESEANDKE